MKMDYNCLTCLVNQAVKVAEMTGAPDREGLFRKVFAYLSSLDFSKSNPEISGDTFEILKEHTGNSDPYKEIRAYYNKLFLGMSDTFRQRIDSAQDPFYETVKYAIVGNIIDFNPAHNSSEEDILRRFENAGGAYLTVNHTDNLKADIEGCKRLLYLGDNCGEICLDKLLLREIKRLNPQVEIYFGVRGTPVVNDSIEEDAYFVGIDSHAKIISNGDGGGTVLKRVSAEFRRIYDGAEVVIAKGQANFESLSGENGKNIYYLLVTKCGVIANAAGAPLNSLVCMNNALTASPSQ